MATIGRGILLLIAALYASGQEVSAPVTGSLPTAAEIDSVLNDLSGITGFPVRKKLPFEMVTREQVNHFLKEQIRRSVKPDEIRAEEATLKKFGFVPADFDLKQTTIDLLTEQAAAYYDFHRKKLFISDWAARNMREAALVHELAHALADQSFSIQKFLRTNSDDSEESLARESVVEGQASWLMVEWAARRVGRSLKDPETARQFLQEESEGADSSYPVFSKAPLYIRRTLMFPYEEGQRFQQAVFLKDGQQAFADVFTHPPVTTAQIIHPDRYFQKVGATAPGLPKPLPHSKAFVSGTLGELDQQILLRQYTDLMSADAIAPRLKGASYRIDEEKSGRRQMLLYASEWADEDSAARYFDAYQQVLRGKWKQIDVSTHDATRFAGRCEDGYFSVVRKGNRVLSEEGFADPVTADDGA